MRDSSEIRAAILTIANGLGELNEQTVFVGGAVLSLYVDDDGAGEVRPTKDIDITLQIATLSALETLRQTLTKKGFTQSAADDVVCRFRYKGIKVDVMSTKEVGWAPSNLWFGEGFSRRETFTLLDKKIQLLPLSYFMATKIAAFRDRGAIDPRTSHDFEDITYLLDNRSDLAPQVINAPQKVRNYLIDFFQEITDKNKLQEALIANLDPIIQVERKALIMEKLKEIINSNLGS
ncbi:MAG: nucleotidyl transferase AbiEii/AbiGii toxin family protein [Phaeodactylibacter sp.]|nr:nucleotidyl transferase AbiEii/AbiGii toxin family protein [Phaeodactylibacter sp.]